MHRKVTCYIRKNRNKVNLHLLPWTMECYPLHTGKLSKLQRRDFDCRSRKEAKAIAHAIYGDKSNICF